LGNILSPRVNPSFPFTARSISQIQFYRASLSLSPSLSQRRLHRTLLLHHRATATASLTAGDRAPRVSHVRGRTSLVVGGVQLKRKEETARGVDLDPLGSSAEKKEALICAATSLSRRSLKSRRGTTLHRLIYSGELLLFSATRSLIWRGPLGYVPWRKRISRSSTSSTFSSFKVNRDQTLTLIPRSI
jgi:hypothetical protein